MDMASWRSWLVSRQRICLRHWRNRERITHLIFLFPFRISSQPNGSILIILCSPTAVRCSLQTLSADSLMPASVNRSPSVKFKTLNVFSVVLGPGSLTSSKEYFYYCIYFLGIFPASNCSWPTFRNPVSVPSSKAECRQWVVPSQAKPKF